MTKDENAKLFRLLHGLYRNAKDITEDVELAYYIALKPYDYLEVREAVLSLAQRARFFPDVADIVELLPNSIAKRKAARTPDIYESDPIFMARIRQILEEDV